MFNRDRLLLLLPWCIALVLAGCGQSPAETGSTRTTAESDTYGSYHGLVSIEEQILWDDVVARVRLISVDGAVVVEPGGTYRGALEFRFRVLEYIKGSGGSEIVAVTIDEGRYDIASAARAAVPGMVATRDTRWDGREAIVFLGDYHAQNGRTTYLLGGHTVYGEDGYTVASRHLKTWLPEAATTTGTGARSTDAAEKRFLLDDPSSGGASGAQRASVETAPTITLSALKAKVAELRGEIDAGGGGSEEYRSCIARRYALDRRFRWEVGQGKEPYRFETYVDSGMPAGSQADKDGPSAPVASGYWLGGRDKDLFTVVTTTPEGYPNHVQHDVVTARPLPAGEYRFNIHVLQPDILICGGWSEFVKNTGGTYVTVTAPAGTVHEAFFDPVAIAAAVGADGTNGVLKPAAFTVDGASATITSLKWEAGTVTMG